MWSLVLIKAETADKRIRREAETADKGLTLVNWSYVIAINLWRERFGENQVLILAYMRKFIIFKPVLNISNFKTLQTLYDTIKTQVRLLDSLGQDCSNYGLMLIPVLLTKLPSELNLQIIQKSGKDIWGIREALDLISLEIEAREKVAVHEEKSKSVSMSIFGVILVRIFPHSNSVYLRIQSECRKMETRITPNTDTFFAMRVTLKMYILQSRKS